MIQLGPISNPGPENHLNLNAGNLNTFSRNMLENFSIYLINFLNFIFGGDWFWGGIVLGGNCFGRDGFWGGLVLGGIWFGGELFWGGLVLGRIGHLGGMCLGGDQPERIINNAKNSTYHIDAYISILHI